MYMYDNAQLCVGVVIYGKTRFAAMSLARTSKSKCARLCLYMTYVGVFKNLRGRPETYTPIHVYYLHTDTHAGGCEPGDNGEDG